MWFLFGRLIAYPYNKIGGSKPFPGRKHSIAPRFGYKQLTELFALRVAPYDMLLITLCLVVNAGGYRIRPYGFIYHASRPYRFAYKKSPTLEQGFDIWIDTLLLISEVRWSLLSEKHWYGLCGVTTIGIDNQTSLAGYFPRVVICNGDLINI